VDVHVSLVGRNDLAGEIYRQLRRAVLDGRMQPGEALPPSRELARRLNVSRATVTVAYDRLSGEGLVTARAGAGTFVSDEVPRPSRRRIRPRGALRPRPVWNDIPLPTAFDAPAEFDFRTGLPDASRFPYATWRQLMARELRPSAVGRGYYGHPAGHPALREAIVRHIGTARGVAAVADDVTVTNGTQQALDLIARVLLAPGDRVAVEDPTYPPVRLLFTSLGLRVTGVPVDDQGIVVDALPHDARLVYVTPSHQYPLGSPMSLPRRTALLAWARRHNAAIVEDDYDSEFRYGGRPIEPLQTLDAEGRVLYVASFSKTMLPSLRLGFVLAPAAVSEALRAAKYVADWYTPLPTQLAMASFIDEGWFARHVRRMRAIYQVRHDVIVDALSQQLSDHLTVIPSSVGLHVSAIANVASPADVDAVVDRSLTAGAAVHRLSVFQFDQPSPPGIAIGYGAIQTDAIGEGLYRLQQAFDDAARLGAGRP
jgi:GntR family transcriptional regulator/MocR family aminotransferase